MGEISYSFLLIPFDRKQRTHKRNKNKIEMNWNESNEIP